MFHTQFSRDGIIQNVDGRIIKMIIVLVQFNDQMFVLGSNDENKLVIIFSLF